VQRDSGITIRKGRRYIEEALPGILEDADNKLSGLGLFGRSLNM
jgi:hypothetical protein